MARPRLLIRACYKCKTTFTEENCSASTFKSGMGLCYGCQKIKSADYYKRNRDAQIEKSKKYFEEHPELVKKYADRQKQKYQKLTDEQKRTCGSTASYRKYYLGVSPEKFDAMLISQDGRCEICNDPLHKTCLDHNHTTKKVRDILCDNCNKLLGHAKEKIDILVSAIQYLRKHADDSSIQIDLHEKNDALADEATCVLQST